MSPCRKPTPRQGDAPYQLGDNARPPDLPEADRPRAHGVHLIRHFRTCVLQAGVQRVDAWMVLRDMPATWGDNATPVCLVYRTEEDGCFGAFRVESAGTGRLRCLACLEVVEDIEGAEGHVLEGAPSGHAAERLHVHGVDYTVASLCDRLTRLREMEPIIDDIVRRGAERQRQGPPLPPGLVGDAAEAWLIRRLQEVRIGRRQQQEQDPPAVEEPGTPPHGAS